MSLCHRIKRGWNAFKNIVYGYDESVDPQNENRVNHRKEEQEKATKYEYFSIGGTTRVFRAEYKPTSRSNYCIPKGNTKYEAYGLEFETRQDRDAFECKMKSMERILEKELYDIKQQHVRLRKQRYEVSFLNKNLLKQTDIENSLNKWTVTDSFSVSDSSTFLQGSSDPLVEEMSILNELQDVYELMFNLSKELKNIENILKIEVRERTLHPEPRLIHIIVPEDELSQQMKSDGGLRYCSSDRTVHQITYETLPPPLSLEDLMAKERDT